MLLILPETDAKGAKVLSERIIRSFFARNIPNIKSEHKLLSLSASLAEYTPDISELAENWQTLLDDTGLYLQIAKSQGGNCCMHRNTETEEACQ